jgi:hypothetical protein
MRLWFVVACAAGLATACQNQPPMLMGTGTSTGGSTTGGNGTGGTTTTTTTGGCGVGMCTFSSGGCGWNVAGSGPCPVGGTTPPGSLPCCAGLTCQSDNTCEPGGTTTSTTGGNGCQGDAGAPCVTNADCATTLCSVTASQAQTGPSAVGICDVPPTPATIDRCSPAETACGGAGDAPCCGYCGADVPTRFCHDLPHACGNGGTTCATDDDCCATFACVGAVCKATCGQNLAACDPTNRNSDCCTNLGFTCLSTVTDAGGVITQSVYGADVCFNQLLPEVEANPLAACQAPARENACGDAGECLLGSPCAPVTAAGQIDACAAAGLACDFNSGVCRFPQWQESCNPAGPPCDYAGNSRDNSYLCENPGNSFTTSGGMVVPPFCNQLCATAGDCVNPLAQCYPLGAPANQSICLFYSQTTAAGAGCTNYFGMCNASGTNDGICLQINTGRGECWQTAASGGAAGAACDDNANRQNPLFCDSADFCIGNTCDQLCDPAGGAPTCPTNATCVGVSATATPTYGVCAVSCDFTAADGGGCSAGQKCALPYIFGLADQPVGACIGLAINAQSLGEPCMPGFPDPCGIGLTCEGDPNLGGNIGGFWCHQSCTNPGDACADGTPCIGYTLGQGAVSTSQGFCTGTAVFDAGR